MTKLYLLGQGFDQIIDLTGVTIDFGNSVTANAGTDVAVEFPIMRIILNRGEPVLQKLYGMGEGNPPENHLIVIFKTEVDRAFVKDIIIMGLEDKRTFITADLPDAPVVNNNEGLPH